MTAEGAGMVECLVFLRADFRNVIVISKAVFAGQPGGCGTHRNASN